MRFLGDQATLLEVEFPQPSIYNNTGPRLALENKISIDLIIEPKAHFNSKNYTEFKVKLGNDYINNTSAPISVTNTFGETISCNPGDIVPDHGLSESFRVDRIYDVYIESITTFNIKTNNSKNTMTFLLDIQDWNIENNTNLTNCRRSVIIPNESKTLLSTQTHKSKKLNYLSYLKPRDILNISGSISFLDGTSIFDTPSNNLNRISLEMILIPRN